MPKDEGLIASESDFLNTELRMNYGDHLQVDPDDDWRPAIRGLVHGVRHGEAFNRRWRPIKTAPKDGTAVLSFQSGTSQIFLAAYRRNEIGLREGWYIYEGGGYYFPIPRKPTHWMPLPDPPTSV